MTNQFNDLSSLEFFDVTGPVNYSSKLDDFEDAYSTVEQDAGYILEDNLQDRSFRAALRIAGWNPTGDPQAEAVEWYQMDYEYGRCFQPNFPVWYRPLSQRHVLEGIIFICI